MEPDGGGGSGELPEDRIRRIVGVLILRHLHDGEEIDYPIPEDHRYRAVFEELETRGLIERWDRIWPLHDRYRLTPRGMAGIVAVRRPEEADQLFEEMHERGLAPRERHEYLIQHGYDPAVWSAVNDTSVTWTDWESDPGEYWRYVCEELPADTGLGAPAAPPPRPSVMDLDREARRTAPRRRDRDLPASDVS
jgi:pentatricopeptide repeat protein